MGSPGEWPLNTVVEVTDVALDGSGNIYVVGDTASPAPNRVDFGNGVQISGTELSTTFIVKY